MADQVWAVPKRAVDQVCVAPKRATYLVISPGKHITVAIVSVNGSYLIRGFPKIVLVDSKFEPCVYAPKGSPDLARARVFADSVVASVKSLLDDTGEQLASILVRTPPPPSAMPKVRFLQENTWMEAFVVGTLFGHFPRCPIFYVHPKEVAASLFPGIVFKTWEDEEFACMRMAKDLASTSFIKHEREALCIAVALHHFIRR
jgi:hypothetical protein